MFCLGSGRDPTSCAQSILRRHLGARAWHRVEPDQRLSSVSFTLTDTKHPSMHPHIMPSPLTFTLLFGNTDLTVNPCTRNDALSLAFDLHLTCRTSLTIPLYYTGITASRGHKHAQVSREGGPATAVLLGHNDTIPFTVNLKPRALTWCV